MSMTDRLYVSFAHERFDIVYRISLTALLPHHESINSSEKCFLMLSILNNKIDKKHMKCRLERRIQNPVKNSRRSFLLTG